MTLLSVIAATSTAYSEVQIRGDRGPHRQRSTRTRCAKPFFKKYMRPPKRYDLGGERLKYTCYVFEIIIIMYIPSKNFFPKFDCLQNIEE